MNRTLTFLTLTATLLPLIAPGVVAQGTTKPATPAPLADPTSSAADYRLATDDVISVTISNDSEFNKELVVPRDGKIMLAPLKHSIMVTGMTPEELQLTLSQKLKEFLIDPDVTVSLVQMRKDNVLVYGFVLRPGVAEYKSPMRLLEALAQVGGAAPGADLRKVTLSHKQGGKQVVDVSHPETKQGTEIDLMLDAGDVIYVPERHLLVSIDGEVKAPGDIPYKDDMTVQEAITAAGGADKEQADLEHTMLTRDGKEMPLDLKALYEKGDSSQNIKLQPGDQLSIPELKDKIYVFGAVGKQGYYHSKPEDSLMDALDAAGGPAQDADTTQIEIIHMSKDKPKGEVEKVNLFGHFNPGKQKQNKSSDITFERKVSPGDVIFVPTKHHKTNATDIWGALSVVNIVHGLFGL